MAARSRRFQHGVDAPRGSEKPVKCRQLRLRVVDGFYDRGHIRRSTVHIMEVDSTGVRQKVTSPVAVIIRFQMNNRHLGAIDRDIPQKNMLHHAASVGIGF